MHVLVTRRIFVQTYLLKVKVVVVVVVIVRAASIEPRF